MAIENDKTVCYIKYSDNDIINTTKGGRSLKRKAEKGPVNRKIITLKNFEIVDGYIKDRAVRDDSNDSAVIESILLNQILPPSAIASYYISMIYRDGLKQTVMTLMQDLSAGIQWKAAHDNALPLVRMVMEMVQKSYIAVDEDFAYLMEEHLPSNCRAIVEKLNHESEKNELNFNIKQLLKDDEMLLSMTDGKSVDFVPYNYFRLVVSWWDWLGDYTFTFRLLYDVVALTEKGIWDTAEYRLRARDIIGEVCSKWDK